MTNLSMIEAVAPAATQKISKTLQQNSIPAPVGLAADLKEALKSRALDAAVFLQQLHYWICKEQGEIDEGERWIYNSYREWCKQLEWLTDYGFRQIKAGLLKIGIIKVKQLGLRQEGRDRSCWYTINYNHEFLKDVLISTDAPVEIPTYPSVDCSTSHTETTSELTPNTTDAVVKENNAEPTDQQLEDAKREISRLTPDIEINSQVLSAVASNWDNFPAAMARVKKAIFNGWCKFPTGLLVKSLRCGVPMDELPVDTRADLPEDYPHPTPEQIEWLEATGEKLDYIAMQTKTGFVEVLHVVLYLQSPMPWWKYFE